MSYARIGTEGCYIYPDDVQDTVYFDGYKIPNNIIDIFLYKISEYHPKELKERIDHGKQLCDNWIKDVVELETNKE